MLRAPKSPCIFALSFVFALLQAPLSLVFSPGLARADQVGHEHSEILEDSLETDHSETDKESHRAREVDEHENHEAGIIQLSPGVQREANLQVQVVEKRLFSKSVRTTGELELHPDRIARVGPRIEGRVEELLVQEGDRVRKGQVLARLLSVQLGEAKAEFLARRAKLELAQSNFEREKSLRAKGIIPEKDLLEAEAHQIEARVELDSAENHLHILGLTETEIQGLKSQEHDLPGFEVRSPIAGIVLERPISLGQMAKETSTLFVIADLSQLWAQINVFERDLSSVDIGAEVTIELDAYPGEPLLGEISYLSVMLDERSRAARARVVVDNPRGRLRPGMFLTAQVEDFHRQGLERLVIPESAIQRSEQGNFVFVAEKGAGRYRQSFIELGKRSDGFAIVESGLEEGMLIVSQGSFLLKSELAKESLGGGHNH